MRFTPIGRGTSALVAQRSAIRARTRAAMAASQSCSVAACSAASAPAPQCGRSLRDRRLGQRRQHLLRQAVEHGSISKETRNGDAAECGKMLPFRGIALEIVAIGPAVREMKLAETPADALAYLTVHAAKARPNQTEPRQRPFQEFDAARVSHGERIVRVDNVASCDHSEAAASLLWQTEISFASGRGLIWINASSLGLRWVS